MARRMFSLFERTSVSGRNDPTTINHKTHCVFVTSPCSNKGNSSGGISKNKSVYFFVFWESLVSPLDSFRFFKKTLRTFQNYPDFSGYAGRLKHLFGVFSQRTRLFSEKPWGIMQKPGAFNKTNLEWLFDRLGYCLCL